MKRPLLAALLVIAPSSALAQISPSPSLEDPRIQTVVHEPNIAVRLVAFPDAGLKLVFQQGEAIRRVVVSDGAAFGAAVIGRGDTIEIVPQHEGAAATMRVETDRRNYEFALETGNGLAAAYLIRFVPGEQVAVVSSSEPLPGAQLVQYRLGGARVLRPDTIFDDGLRTFIEWSEGRALPAVFGVGPSGGEELVAGYMRGGKYVIDRVYPELVFRFDKERATAKRDAGKS